MYENNDCRVEFIAYQSPGHELDMFLSCNTAYRVWDVAYDIAICSHPLGTSWSVERCGGSWLHTWGPEYPPHNSLPHSNPGDHLKGGGVTLRVVHSVQRNQSNGHLKDHANWLLYRGGLLIEVGGASLGLRGWHMEGDLLVQVPL